MTELRIQTSQTPDSVGVLVKSIHRARGEAQRIKRIFDSSAVPMVIADAGRRYVEVNRPGRLALRLSLDEVTSFKIDDLTPSRLDRDLKQAWTRLLETGVVAGRYQVAGCLGSRLDIDYYGIADALPGLQLIAFAPADWCADEPDATEDDRSDCTVSLTPREIQVLMLAAEGHSGPQLAAELALSPATVNTHFKNIYKKLCVSTRAAAVAKAMRLGVIE